MNSHTGTGPSNTNTCLSLKAIKSRNYKLLAIFSVDNIRYLSFQHFIHFTNTSSHWFPP